MGSRPAAPTDFKAAQKLAKALGVSLTFLLTGEEEEASKEASITHYFKEGESVFEGYAKISIQRMIPRKEQK